MKYSAVESEAMTVITTLIQKLSKGSLFAFYHYTAYNWIAFMEFFFSVDTVPLNQRIHLSTFEKMMISLEALRNHNQPELKSKAKELLMTITGSVM